MHSIKFQTGIRLCSPVWNLNIKLTKYGNHARTVAEFSPQADGIRYAAAICSDAIRFIGLTDIRQTAMVRRSAAGWAR